MTAPMMPRPAPERDLRPALALCAAGVVFAVAAAYSRSLGGAFLFDDVDSIAGNPTIRHLSGALMPPGGATVSGRPVLNLSFAVNYAVSGTRAWSYHALNIAIHAAAALALLGIVRRGLGTPAAGSRPQADSLAIAFGVSLLWALHPLQTESVAYVVQRAESLMGLLYLLTLYAFIRHAGGGSRAPLWAGVAFLACLLGMATKEVMATVPVIVFLYDRTFLGGSFREAWRRRKASHLALAACWLPLALWVARSGGRGGTAGFGSGVSWRAYSAAQLEAVAHYLRLALWPHPLVGDYGRALGVTPLGVGAGALVVGSLFLATCILLRLRPAAGFLGAWFLVILAPSSSVIPVSTEIMAEHRMYLPLAALVTAGVLVLHDALNSRRVFLGTVIAIAFVLGTFTWRRSRVYDGPFPFWSDVALKAPGNAGAWNNLGVLRASRGDQAGAIADYGRALAIAPAFATAHFNLGRALTASGRPEDAVPQFDAALGYLPGDPSIHTGLGNALALENRGEAAAAEYRVALVLDPGRADAWFDLADLMVRAGDLPKAAQAYSHAVELSPGYAEARIGYGNVLAQMGRGAEAARQYEEALRLEPGAADVRNNLGSLYAQMGRLPEARAELEEALRLRPDYRDAKDNLERVRVLEGPGARP